MTDAEIDALVPLPQPGINTASHSHLRVVGYPAEQVLAHTRAAVRAALSARLAEPVQPVAFDLRKALVTAPMCQAADKVQLGDKESGDITLSWDEYAALYLAMQSAAPTVQPVAVPDGMAEAVRLAHVAVSECPDGQPMASDWMDCAMKACRLLAAAPKGGA